MLSNLSCNCYQDNETVLTRQVTVIKHHNQDGLLSRQKVLKTLNVTAQGL